jgi:hypothetical protein
MISRHADEADSHYKRRIRINAGSESDQRKSGVGTKICGDVNWVLGVGSWVVVRCVCHPERSEGHVQLKNQEA